MIASIAYLSFFILHSSLFIPVLQAPPRERHLVYGIQAFNGLGYSSAFAPPAGDTIYLLAGADSALSPRQTEIYWWPLTNRFEPDWEALNQPIGGTLEVWRAFERLESIEAASYVVQASDGPGGPGELYVGERALAKYAEFEARRRAYRDALWDYYQQDAEYRRALQDAVARAGRGETTELAEPPREPSPLRLYSTALNQGYVLNLAAGRYRIRLLGPDGRVVPESDRNVVVFSPRRQGLSYAVYPQTRWTRPTGADDPKAIVYLAAGGVLYFQPFVSVEVNDRYFSRLEDPQNRAVQEETWRWVRVRPYSDAHLELEPTGQPPSRFEQKRYQVQQLPGGGLGYQIVEQPPEAVGRAPDLDAFRVEVESGRTYRLRLLTADGEPLPAGEREIRPVAQPDSWSLAAVPAIPFALACGLAIRRRWS